MKKFYFLVLLLLTFSAFAQNYSYTVYNTSNSGIASNYVGDIKIDANGVLWISSYSGVSTFNGTTFTKYNTSNSAIASNAILKIEIDGLGRKWMATQSNGISRLNGSAWTNYTTSNSGLPNNAIKDIAVDGLNNLWVATSSGLTKFNGTTWTTYTSLTNINSLATDSNNGVWVTNNNILYKFNGTDFNLIDQGTEKILHIENNILYCTTGDGLLTYSSAGTFLNLQYQSNSCLSGYQYNDVDVDSNNKVWVAFQGDGLQNFTDCISYTSNSGLPDNYISTVRTQANGTIWSGTLQLGLVKMTPSASTCNAPTQTWAENITPTTAVLNWIPAVPSPDSYVIRYNTTNVIGGIQDATASTSISIANLNPNADYYWWVASVCGEQQSNWAFGGFFGTPQPATCNAPTNTTIYNLGSTSCLIGWTAPTPTPTSGYEVYLSTSSVTPGVNTTPTYTSNSTSVNIPSGLTPTTSYYVWVRSNCGNTKSNWTPVVNFVTNGLSGCNTAEHGLFPAATFTPACSGANETIVTNAWAGEYSNVTVNSNHQYTFSSSFTTDIITITNDANVILASGTTPLSWSSGSTSGIIRYYLHANSLCHSQNTNRIRYIQCIASQTCGVPTALTVSNITSNSCRLTWNAPTPAASSYDLYVSTNNTAPVTATTATQTSNGNIVGSLNGLATSTTYYYWVRSNCNGTKSAWVSGGSFTTIAALSCNGAIYGLYPETTFTPTCSASSEQIATDAWAGEYTNVNVTSNHQYTFASSIATDYITITNASGTAVLASGTSPLVWNSNATAGIIRYHLNTNANCGVQNSGRVKFIQCTVSSSCGLPTNLAVSNITSNSCRLLWNPPTLTTPNSYDLYVSTNNTAPIATTTATQISNSSAVGALSGLSASTTYYYWVRSNCNGIKSAWVSGGSFTTIAALNCNGATYGLYPATVYTPLCTGNTEEIIANAWAGEYTNVNIAVNKQYTFTSSIASDYITITNTTGTTVLASGLTPLSWNSNNTSGVIRYYLHANANCGDQNTNRIRFIKCANATSCNPPTNFGSEVISSTSAVIGWVPSTSAPNGGYLYVYNTSPTIGGVDGSTSSTSADLTNLSPNTTYYWWVASNCVSSQSDWAFGGSFTTYAASGCNAPTQLYYDGLSSTSNNIGWAAPTPAPSNGYVYCYSTVNDPFSDGAISGTTTDTFTVLNNLSPNTTYYFWVKSNCGNTQTNWISGPSFTTPQAGSCNPPTQFWTDGINATTATIGWVPPTNTPDSYIYTYNTTNEIIDIQDSTVFTSAILENLIPNTDYHWWVASVCGETQTAWTYGGVFTTLQGTPTYCFEKVSGGLDYTIAIKSDGTLWAWGNNTYGQLGDGTTIDKLTPVQIGTSSDWTDISCGLNHNMALKANGTLWSWGRNLYGQLGDGTTVNKTVPTQVGTETNWVSIETRYHHNLGIKSNGTLWGWGQNLFGQVGDGTNGVLSVAVPTQVGADTNWKTAATGNSHSLAIKTNGTLWGWGNNLSGQLGNGAYNDNITPLQIGTSTDWKTVDAGYDFTIATKTNNTLWSCGANTYGELGLNNSTMNVNNFTQVGTATTWDIVSCGRSHVVASRNYGALFAWGQNNYGQIGNGSTTNLYTPTLQLNVNSWIAVSTGFYHSLAIDNDGGLYTWGYNSNGQLGNGTTLNDQYVVGTIACPTNNLSVDDFTKSEMKFYPNPVSDILNISFEQGISAVVVYNLLGQEVFSKPFNSNEVSINMSNLASGTYLVKVNAGNATKTVKIIKL